LAERERRVNTTTDSLLSQTRKHLTPR